MSIVDVRNKSGRVTNAARLIADYCSLVTVYSTFPVIVVIFNSPTPIPTATP